jgi:hypothetical protein
MRCTKLSVEDLSINEHDGGGDQAGRCDDSSSNIELGEDPCHGIGNFYSANWLDTMSLSAAAK